MVGRPREPPAAGGLGPLRRPVDAPAAGRRSSSRRRSSPAAVEDPPARPRAPPADAPRVGLPDGEGRLPPLPAAPRARRSSSPPRAVGGRSLPAGRGPRDLADRGGAGRPVLGAPAAGLLVGGRGAGRGGRSGCSSPSGRGRREAIAQDYPAGRRPRNAKKAPANGGLLQEIRRRPTLPGGLPPSTIGAGGLNFRVRHGNGCNSTAIATGNLLSTGDDPENLIASTSKNIPKPSAD